MADSAASEAPPTAPEPAASKPAAAAAASSDEPADGNTSPAPIRPACELEDGMGVCEDGKTRFLLPRTIDVMAQLMRWPGPWGLVAWPLFLTELSTFFLGLPPWFFIVQTLFWRAAYNIGLGTVLKRQSDTQFITRFVRQTMADPGSSRNQFLGRLLRCGVADSKNFDHMSMPAEFNAWILYRLLVDLILPSDVLCFGLFVFKFCHPFGMVDIPAVLASFALVGFSTWVKVDAHKLLGSYGWYWGDFFFRKEGELVFGGVFSYFPEPMYLMAYTWMYATALFSRNYAVLAVGIAAHLSQMAFLVLVESPHTAKVWGTEELDTLDSQLTELGFLHKDEPVGFFNIHSQPAEATLTVTALGYMVALHFFMAGLGWQWVLAHAVVWRIIYVVGPGVILSLQHRREAWTKLFRSRQAAFFCWKRIYNFVMIMTVSSHVLCALFLFECPERIFTVPNLAWVLLSIGLFGIQAWSSISSWRALGATGFYYSNFFIEGVPFKVTYKGIYRYANHPDSVTGFAGLYGLAVLVQSPTMGVFALFCQLCHLAFLRLVEHPHNKRLYGEHRREDAALWAAIKKTAKQAKTIIEDDQERQRFVDEVKEKAQRKSLQFTRAAKRALVDDVRDRILETTQELERLKFWVAREEARSPPPGSPTEPSSPSRDSLRRRRLVSE